MCYASFGYQNVFESFTAITVAIGGAGCQSLTIPVGLTVRRFERTISIVEENGNISESLPICMVHSSDHLVICSVPLHPHPHPHHLTRFLCIITSQLLADPNKDSVSRTAKAFALNIQGIHLKRIFKLVESGRMIRKSIMFNILLLNNDLCDLSV